MAYVIGVDCGTSGTKTVLFDEKGTVILCISLKTAMQSKILLTGQTQ